MKVFQTGSSGYAGTVVAEALVAAGHQVAGLARTEKSASRLRAKGIIPVRGDLTDEGTIRRAASEADGVVHLAWSNDAKMAEADQRAAGAILAALTDTQKPFVYTSGLWVLGSTGDRIADESTPVNSTPIVAWRPAVEGQVLHANKMRGIVIRPGNLYGRGGGIIAMMMQWAQRDGVVTYVGTGENRWPMAHVEDLANLYVLAVEKAPHGTLLHACPVRGIRVREIAEAIARVMGIPGKVRPWPLEEARRTLGPFAHALALDAQASGTLAQRLLGWRPTKPSVLEEIEHGSYARLANPAAT